MKRARLSQLAPWCVKSPLLGRIVAGLIMVALPVIAAGAMVVYILDAACKEIAEGCKATAKMMHDLFIVAFLPWENDLK